MIHFFPASGKSEANSPFGDELVRLGVEHRFFGYPVNMRYRTRAGLLFRVYPRLFWANARAAIRSFVLSTPRPDVVVVGTDILALIVGTLGSFLRRRPLIVFQSLILTPKKSAFARMIQRAVYTIVLNMADLAICHSRIEVEKYRAAYPNAKCVFCFIPYGTTVTRRLELIAAASEKTSQPREKLVIASAGRSGRDYQTLVQATRGLPCEIHIVCDTDMPVRGLAGDDRVKVIKNVYNDDYLRVLAEADIVVIPLASDDVSAGQMVLLQAFALQKPVIISRTSTTIDYLDEGVEGLMVGIGRADEMRAAIEQFFMNAASRSEFGAQAACRFEADFATEVYIRRLVGAINEALGRRMQARSR